MTMPVGGDGGGAMCGGVREEVGPVTYLLPLPTHTRLTELELEEEEKESGRGRASQIGTLEAKVSGRQCQTVVRSSFLPCTCADVPRAGDYYWRDNAVEQSYNYKEAAPCHNRCTRTHS